MISEIYQDAPRLLYIEIHPKEQGEKGLRGARVERGREVHVSFETQQYHSLEGRRWEKRSKGGGRF